MTSGPHHSQQAKEGSLEIVHSRRTDEFRYKPEREAAYQESAMRGTE